MSEIRCLILDVDGVLTDGRLWYGQGPEPLRAFHIHDGIAIEWFRELLGEVALLTGKTSAAVQTRARELGIRHVIQGSRDKLADCEELLRTLELGPENAAVMGDDLPDVPVMRACGYPIAPANAAAEVRSFARYVTRSPGGNGAVREAVEHLLRGAGRWEDVLARYGATAVASP